MRSIGFLNDGRNIIRKHEGTLLLVHPHACPAYARVPMFALVHAYALFNVGLYTRSMKVTEQRDAEKRSRSRGTDANKL